MRRNHLLILSLLSSIAMSAQTLHLISTDYDLYSLDLSDCSLNFITDVNFNLVYDISFHPDGSLYGIARNGELIQIDTSTGETEIIHIFPYPDNQLRYNSLVITEEGVIYTLNERGELYSYDSTTGIETYHGNVGYESAGDITFYQGAIYLGARSQRIIQVDLESPPNSSILVDDLLRHNIFGLTSINTNCTETTYVVSTESNLDNSELYQFNWETNTAEFLCDLDVGFFGSAHPTEIFSSSDSMTLEELMFNPTSCGLDDGSISLSIEGGNGEISYSIDGINFQSDSLFENLPADAYMITAMDDIGCILTEDVLIETTEGIVYDDVIVRGTSCGLDNGSLEVFASGGLEPYEYSIDQINYQPSNSFENLGPDSYTVSAMDASGCMTMEVVDIGSSIALSIENIETMSSFCGEDNGEVTFQINGGVDPVQLFLNSVNYSPGNAVVGLASATYDLMLIDNNDCQVDTSFIIDQTECLIYIPNTFSPNGDGQNDVFIISPHPSFRGTFLEFRIYDRWGSLLFESENFDIDLLTWDGTYNGVPLNAGVYVYTLTYAISEQKIETLKGDITLLP